MLSSYFYSATLDSICQSKYFLSQANALAYLEEEFRKQCAKVFDMNETIDELYKTNQITGFGWIEEHQFEEYKNI